MTKGIYAWHLMTPTISTDLVTSPFVSPLVLGSVRLIIGIYMLGTAVAVLVVSSVHSSKPDAGIASYFLASGVQTLAYTHRRGWLQQNNSTFAYPLQGWPLLLQFLHRLLWSTITTFPIIVSVVFWTILAGPNTFSSPYLAWSNITQHLFNTLFALFEILCTNCGPSPWSHLPFLVLILGAYLGLAYITHAVDGFYPYSFLDPKNGAGLLAVYIIGIPAAECLVFAVVRWICLLRERVVGNTERNLKWKGGYVDAGREHEEDEGEDWGGSGVL